MTALARKLMSVAFMFAATLFLLSLQTTRLSASHFDSITCGPWNSWAAGETGPYCSVHPGDSQSWCVDENNGLNNPSMCSEICGACGRASAGMTNCEWQRAQGAYPCDPTYEWKHWLGPVTCGCVQNCMDSCFGDSQCECEACNHGRWVCDGSVCGCGQSPILLNTKTDSANDQLTAVEAGVWFDLSGNGAVRTAWTTAGSPVGFLVRDLNGNATIDSGAELFGTATRTRTGAVAANGFEALRDLDDNNDGRLDSSDSAFSELRIWIDTNHNGASEANELMTLADLGITAIGTAYEERKRHDQFGNWYRYEGHLTIEGHQRRMFDVYLLTDTQ